MLILRIHLHSYQILKKKWESNSQLLIHEKLFIPKHTSLAPNAAFSYTKLKIRKLLIPKYS